MSLRVLFLLFSLSYLLLVLYRLLCITAIMPVGDGNHAYVSMLVHYKSHGNLGWKAMCTTEMDAILLPVN